MTFPFPLCPRASSKLLPKLTSSYKNTTTSTDIAEREDEQRPAREHVPWTVLGTLEPSHIRYLKQPGTGPLGDRTRPCLRPPWPPKFKQGRPWGLSQAPETRVRFCLLELGGGKLCLCGKSAASAGIPPGLLPVCRGKWNHTRRVAETKHRRTRASLTLSTGSSSSSTCLCLSPVSHSHSSVPCSQRPF